MQDTVMSLSANVNVRPSSGSGGEMGMYLNHHINNYISLTRLRCPLVNHSAAISFRETMTGHHWQSNAQESEFVPQCINLKETRDIGTEIKNETGECDKIRITCIPIHPTLRPCARWPGFKAASDKIVSEKDPSKVAEIVKDHQFSERHGHRRYIAGKFKLTHSNNPMSQLKSDHQIFILNA